MINSYLLGDIFPYLWENLGYWKNFETGNYSLACEELVQKHLSLVKINRDSKILDLACGKGGSLQMLLDECNITRLDAMDLQNSFLKIPKNISDIRVTGNLNLEFKQTILNNSSFPSLFYDLIFCVDSAYHFSSMNDFLSSCKKWLKPGGELVFTTILISSEKNIGLLDRIFFYFSGIHAKSILNARNLEKLFMEKGFVNFYREDLSEPVLLGFSNWIERIKKSRSFKEIFDLDWLKIKGTALFCKRLSRNKNFSYVLLYAQSGY